MSLKTETKVGIFTLAAAAGLVWLTVESGSIGSMYSADDYRMLNTSFDNVDGINVGSKVKVSGVVVGEVANIRLDTAGNATVELAIQKGTPLPANVIAQITSAGLIGEKFVALGTDYIPEGTLPENVNAIPSKGSASFDDIAQNFSQISADLKDVSTALRQSLGGQENAEKLTRIVSNLDNIGSRLNTILSEEIAPGKVEGIVNDIASITHDLQQGRGTLGRLLQEDSTALDDLESAMADFRQVADKVNNGEGTLGRLINDPTTIEKVESALDGLASATSRLEQFRTEVDFYGYPLLAEDVSKGRFEVTLRPRPTRYYLLGLSSDGFASKAEDPRKDVSFAGEDFGDDYKITAQFGHVYQGLLFGQDLGFRIGLYDSTFGIGADMDLPVYEDYFVRIATNMYDFGAENSGTSGDNPHWDVSAKFNLFDNTFYAIGGYDNILNDKYGSPFVGLGFHFEDDDLKYLVGQAL